jgi:hypothetical protein
VNSVVNKNLSLTAFYTLSFANGNNNGSASNAYNLNHNYGRSGFVARNMLFMMGTYNGPWKLRFNPFMIAQSGRPYNITLPTDPLNNFFNQRPAYASSASACTTASTAVSQYVQTSFGCLDTQPNSSETLLPVNLGNGPAALAFNLRISRGFGIGPKLVSATPGQDNCRRSAILREEEARLRAAAVVAAPAAVDLAVAVVRWLWHGRRNGREAA